MADFLSNVGKFGFQIKMIDSRVEGQSAVSEILGAIKTFRKQDIELLAIIRGGGSQEALEVFNNELIVREVAAFPAPVIVAIGHHKDEPLIDFVADLSVSTPSIVATTISKPWNELLLYLERSEREIFGRYEKILGGFRQAENDFQVSLQNFKNKLLNVKIDLGNLLAKTFSGFGQLLENKKQLLEFAQKAIESNNPERQLKLGYSIARHNGKIIRRTGDVKTGDILDLRVSDGTINTEIKNINYNP